MGAYFTEQNRISNLLGATAAGFGDNIDTASVDMAADGGWQNCTFVVRMGTITATGVTTITAQQSADDSTFNSLETATHTLDAADDDQLFVVEVKEPTDRYVRLRIARATANIEIDSVIGIRSFGREGVIAQAVANTVTCVACTSPAEA